MKIAIVGGAGAMGSVFGSLLKTSGNTVTLVDVSKSTVAKIKSDGLLIVNKNNESTACPIDVTTEPGDVGQVDLIITFVKCYHTSGAMTAALPMLGPATTVLSLQNGWGNAEQITAIVGRERVVVGVTYHSASVLSPGVVRHNAAGLTKIGELDGTLSNRLNLIAGVLSSSSLLVEQSQDIVSEIWAKLALNVCTLPTSALLRFTAGELPKHEGTLALMKRLLTETVLVAHKADIAIDESERWESIVSLLRRAGPAKSSMLQDVENLRKTEIDVINGAIVAAGRKFGVPTPYNESLIHLVKSLEETFVA